MDSILQQGTLKSVDRNYSEKRAARNMQTGMLRTTSEERVQVTLVAERDSGNTSSERERER